MRRWGGAPCGRAGPQLTHVRAGEAKRVTGAAATHPTRQDCTRGAVRSDTALLAAPLSSVTVSNCQLDSGATDTHKAVKHTYRRVDASMVVLL